MLRQYIIKAKNCIKLNFRHLPRKNMGTYIALSKYVFVRVYNFEVSSEVESPKDRL